MIRSFLFILIFFIPHISYAGSLPVFIQNSDHVSVQNEIYYLDFTISIPQQSYAYANPKGPGIGKPLSLYFIPINCEIGSPLIDAPAKYTPDYDTKFVWVYRDKIRFYIPVKTGGSGSLLVTAEGLMCTSSGSCIPFKIETSTKLYLGKSHDPGFPISKNLIPFGSDPDKAILSAEDIKFKLKIDKSYTQSNSSMVININSEPLKYSDFSPRFISRGVQGIWTAIFWGLIAGLILNFMPCVLPVLSLKILSFTRQASNKSSIIKQGLSYTGGVISSFLILASLASFAGYSWGSLFQKSEFTLVIVLVLFILSLSLFGVFNLQIPGFLGRTSSEISKNKFTDSYLKGLLAALLATPCSGPLLGATLAWSLAQPALIIFTVFISIGFGMSLPYLIVSLRPSLVLFIPKPGRWTIIFENIMGAMLFISAIYFISILRTNLIIPSIIMLGFAGIASWQFGKFGSPVSSKLTRMISKLIFVTLCTIGLIIPLLYSHNAPRNNDKPGFTMEQLEYNRKTGLVSVVVFSADWCLNCRIVEKGVLFAEGTSKLLKSKNAIILFADITEQNTEGERLLHALGSQSIPFLAVFPSNKQFNRPVCLRDIYTKKDLVTALELAQKNE